MEIREGFVSNSSTTSFTCDGGVIAYNDSCSDADVGITRFSCCHSTCSCSEVDLSSKDNHKLWREAAEAKLKAQVENSSWFNQEDLDAILAVEDFWDFVEECRDYNLYNPESLCPICSFKKFNDDLVYKYMLIKHKLKISDIRKEMKKSFKSFDEFDAWCKENSKK